MKRVFLPVGALLFLLFLLSGQNPPDTSANVPAQFHGAVDLFLEDAPIDTHIRARIAGAVCGDGVISVRDGGSDSVFELQADCGAEGQEVEFEWYRDNPSVATTCTPASTYHANDDTQVNLSCGFDDTFSATWMIENTTDETQFAVYLEPRVLFGLFEISSPGGCGTPSVERNVGRERNPSIAVIAGPDLNFSARVVWPASCVEPGDIVVVGVSSDCPCHSELEIVTVHWSDAALRTDTDCDADVDSADAMRNLFHVAQVAIPNVVACPGVGTQPQGPNDFVWGDLDCDGDITTHDTLTILLIASDSRIENQPYRCPLP